MARCLSLLALLFLLLTIASSEGAIENEFLTVQMVPGSGAVTVSSKRVPNASVVVRFPRETKAVTIGLALWGTDSGIALTHTDGSRTTLRLFPNSPFLHVHTAVHNGGKEPIASPSLDIVDMQVQLGTPSVQSYGTGGLTSPAKRQGSYSFHAYVDGETRNGHVSAWLTHERGVGVLLPGPVLPGANPPVHPLKARIDFGRFQVNAGETRDTDTLLLGFFEDARLGLEAYADAVAKQYAIKLAPRPNVYCTWYHAGPSNEAQVAKNTEFAASAASWPSGPWPTIRSS